MNQQPPWLSLHLLKMSLSDVRSVPSKITKLQNSGDGVQKQVLRLDVTMADAQGMNIGQASEQLVHVELDLEHRHSLLDLGVVARGTIHGFGDVLKHQVEENLFLLGQIGCERR